MPDDPTQALLAALPRLTVAQKPPGTVAIARRDVDALEEPEVAVGWIRERGGRLVHPPPAQAQGRRAGKRFTQTVPGDPYYLLPAAALA
jgi:hypothetical protein